MFLADFGLRLLLVGLQWDLLGVGGLGVWFIWLFLLGLCAMV